MNEAARNAIPAPRTLVVEDDRVARVALTKILEALGQEVLTAACVAEGLQKLQFLPQRVLLDLMLPDGNGLDVLRRVREQNLPIRIAVTTAVEDKEMLKQVWALRPDAVFEKPLHLPDIARWLHKPD